MEFAVDVIRVCWVKCHCTTKWLSQASLALPVVLFQGDASGGGANKAVKAEDFDIDIEKEAHGNRVQWMCCWLFSTWTLSSLMWLTL